MKERNIILILALNFMIIKHTATGSQPNISPYLLYTDGHLIHRLSLDGSRQKTIVNNPTDRNIALDYHFRYVAIG